MNMTTQVILIFDFRKMVSRGINFYELAMGNIKRAFDTKNNKLGML